MTNKLDSHDIALQRAVAANAKIGGSRFITYGGLQVFVPVRDIHQSLDKFRTMGDAYRKDIISSVNKSLDATIPLVRDSKATQQQAISAAQDVAIWFANEILEGRATLEMN